MGGALTVESEVNAGSTFNIVLTVDEATLPPRGDRGGAVVSLEGRRLLVVDDNATNREIVSRQARSWGMEPTVVELPSEALALIDAGAPFDVAVIDMLMPEMDGRELAREIRKRSGKGFPLVLVTSLGRLPPAGSAPEFAAQLSKPIKASHLHDVLMQVVAGKDRGVRGPSPGRDTAEVSPLRILLAEDNVVNQKVALALLGHLGYRADVAWNGQEVIDALASRSYDVVLMDVQMPEMDGLEATRVIRERWPDGRPTIIAMTANAMAEDREACLAAGMDDYVAKPIRPDVLVDALRRASPDPGHPPGNAATTSASDGAIASGRSATG
jgi:CheY-like chemotaxis protein